MGAATSRPEPTPATIDLGLYYHADSGDGPDDPPWPVWSAMAGWWRRRASSRRLVVAGLVAILVVPLVGSAATPAGPPLVPLWTVPDSAGDQVQLAVGEHDVYVAMPTAGGGTLTAYRLADGTRRWQTQLDSPGSWAGVRLVGGVPFVTARLGLDEAVTTAYDPDSGRRWWRQQGTPDTAVAGGLVLLNQPLPGAEPAADGEWPYRMVAVELHTGQPVWTVEIQAGEQLLFGGDEQEVAGDPTHLVSLRRDGRLTSYDLATGEATGVDTDLAADQQRLVQLRENVPPELVGRLRWLVFGAYPLLYTQVGDGLVVLSYRAEGERAVVAYDAGTLSPRWQIDGRSWAGMCQPVICVAPEAGYGWVDGIDPVTGSVRWSLGCTGADAPTGHCHLLPVGVAPGLVLVERWASSRPSGPFFGGAYLGTRIIDADTGEMVTDLGQWRLLARGDGGSWLLSWPERDPGSRTEPPREVTLARLRVDPVRVELLGSIDARGCEPSHAYLVCWSTDRDEADIWQVR